MIDSKVVSHIQLLDERPTWQRLNVIPFIIFHIVSIYTLITYYNENELLALLAVPVSVIFHIFSFLLPLWVVDMDAFINYSKISDISKAKFVKVTPKTHKGLTTICPLEENLHLGTFFNYQKRSYLFNKDRKTFSKLEFPVHKTFQEYVTQANSKSNDSSWLNLQSLSYGENTFNIPSPTFKELYKEHAVAPFFLFQLFSVALWLLDEMWYYAIFILFMLVVLEATVVKQRLRNLESLRNMATPPQQVLVLRNNRWEKVYSQELVPGDICCVTRGTMPLSCDMLLLTGSCIVNEAMLTGESTPLIKESIVHVENINENLNVKKHALHILFGGTTIIQNSYEPTDKYFKNIPTNQVRGCLAYVIRTGFNTSQGKLMRTILFSTQRVTANTRETMWFIMVLIFFAIVASAHVLQKGLEDQSRSRYKLMLNCITILTSVVPPELPVQLSLAVNTSLQKLAKIGIFCTEPFRIPFAGKVNVCCFDKTGTLTEEHLVFKGITGLPDKPPIELITAKDMDEVNSNINYVMAACNSLVYVDKESIGDPMELAALKAVKWQMITPTLVQSKKKPPGGLHIEHRYFFTSALARMSVIVSHSNDSPLKGTRMVLMKGAPEVIKKYLDAPPSWYNMSYLHYARQGKRVIACAYKTLDADANIHSMKREEAESNLTFVGFIIFECPIKPESAEAIAALSTSAHKILMITGDNPLTACQVAKDLKITAKPILILEADSKEKSSESEDFCWQTLDSSSSLELGKKNIIGRFDENSLRNLDKYDFCIYGSSLDMVLNNRRCVEILSSTSVIARASPDQKTQVLTKLRDCGHVTLMCGDGTNDVGALKHADVGIAVLNKTKSDSKNEKEEIKKPIIKDVTRGPPKGMKSKSFASRKLEEAKVEKKVEAAQDTDIVKLGDASNASSFTSKSSSVLPIIDVIRQGRCTLVTTLQMFRILALNCLISAYSLSVLYLDGIKIGDTQATLTGILVASCFLFITQSEPLSTLSKKRPVANIFSLYMFFALLGQFLVHMWALRFVVHLAKENYFGDVLKPDAKFFPNLLNTAVFLISNSMQIATFAVNYEGHPFMDSLIENRSLFGSLVACGLITTVATLELFPPFNAFIQLVPMPYGFGSTIFMIMIADVVGIFLVERISRFLFDRQ
jgi:cation-transporting ATPase 13A1